MSLIILRARLQVISFLMGNGWMPFVWGTCPVNGQLDAMTTCRLERRLRV